MNIIFLYLNLYIYIYKALKKISEFKIQNPPTPTHLINPFSPHLASFFILPFLFFFSFFPYLHSSIFLLFSLFFSFFHYTPGFILFSSSPFWFYFPYFICGGVNVSGFWIWRWCCNLLILFKFINGATIMGFVIEECYCVWWHWLYSCK